MELAFSSKVPNATASKSPETNHADGSQFASNLVDLHGGKHTVSKAPTKVQVEPPFHKEEFIILCYSQTVKLLLALI